MASVLTTAGAVQYETIKDYGAWVKAWQKSRQNGYESVLLTGDQESLTAWLLNTENGEVRASHYRVESSTKLGPPPSHFGIEETLASEHWLAQDWPELGWEISDPASARGKGLFIYPLGPVRADVSESLLYQLIVMGDEIVHVLLQNGFKHRHVREIVHGRTVQEAMPVVSVFTMTSTVHHSLAMALAVESACGTDIPHEVNVTRTLMAELERAMSHLGDLAALAVSTGLPVPQMQYLHLKEQVLRVNYTLFGHRYMKGSVVPGGVTTVLWPENPRLSEAQRVIQQVLHHSTRIAHNLEHTTSFLDRLHGAGVVPKSTMETVRPVGPVGRASGLKVDVRLIRPYGVYQDLKPKTYVMSSADSYARFRIRTQELQQSLTLILELFAGWTPSQVPSIGRNPGSIDFKPKQSWGIGLVEAPRGLMAYGVRLNQDTGRIVHLSVATPSQRNWMAYAPAMANGNILQDFPIIDASFSLSVAGLDG